MTYSRIRRAMLKLSSAGTPSVRRRLSRTSKSQSVITQRALQRATWRKVGTWRSSRLRVILHLFTRLLQVFVSLYSNTKKSTRVAYPRAEDTLINWVRPLEVVPCGSTCSGGKGWIWKGIVKIKSVGRQDDVLQGRSFVQPPGSWISKSS